MAARKKTARKKTTRKKTTRKKTTARRTTARKKIVGRKKKASSRKYGAKAGRKVKRAMHEMRRGELKSGRSGKKVTSRKQAIAIGLNEARKAGGKVPAQKRKRSS